jgi:hypothetical protein
MIYFPIVVLVAVLVLALLLRKPPLDPDGWV